MTKLLLNNIIFIIEAVLDLLKDVVERHTDRQALITATQDREDGDVDFFLTNGRVDGPPPAIEMPLKHHDASYPLRLAHRIQERKRRTKGMTNQDSVIGVAGPERSNLDGVVPPDARQQGFVRGVGDVASRIK